MTISLADILSAAHELAEEEMAGRYERGEATVGELAEEFGVHRATIYRRLIKAGVYETQGGPQPKDLCQRDHDMSLWGRAIASGGRYCLMCKRIRQRVSWKSPRPTDGPAAP